ncbi:MAG TPA: glycerol-3-phosphate dehydrogenase, partial [Telluria sp.]|nr:glycerol-3-phosphate dehydrogenase [Telluria sp.]
RVVLCEKDDLGQHTSSASSKLIHGGLRYLEHYQFGLVRKALAEREVLLKSAPHIMRPLRFVMPHDAGQRPVWMIRAGLFLYDRLAPREFLPGSETVELLGHQAGKPLKRRFTRGFVYSDGWADDARLVVLNAVDARQRGATILTHTQCSAVARHSGHWSATLTHAGGQVQVEARCLVNAAGPWAARFLQGAAGTTGVRSLRLVKGSHIVVPRLFDHQYAYIFQHPDGRIVFAIPYEREFTLVGTTDIEYRGELDKVEITPEETGYLCQLVNRYFERQVGPRDVVWSYAGVRPLLEEAGKSASAATRDYRLERDTKGAPLLSVFGGKITTYRKLAEQAVDWIAPTLGRKAPAWTAKACLPGGNVVGPYPASRGVIEFDQWVARQGQRYPFLPQPLLSRYARAYGTRIDLLLSGRNTLADMGEEIVPGLYAAEAEYLAAHEWASSAEDILWRRTKLGLHVPTGSAQRLQDWLDARHKARAPAGT